VCHLLPSKITIPLAFGTKKCLNENATKQCQEVNIIPASCFKRLKSRKSGVKSPINPTSYEFLRAKSPEMPERKLIKSILVTQNPIFMKHVYFVFFTCCLLLSHGQVNLSGNLSACYALNGNGSEPVNNLTATLSAVTPTVNRFNTPASALYFNGGGLVELPNSPLLKSLRVSVSLWVSLDHVASTHDLVFAYNGCVSNHEGYHLSYENYGTALGFQINATGGNCASQQVNYRTNMAAQANTWYHVGFYAGPDSLILYVNGQFNGSVPNLNPLMYDAGASVYLGNRNQPFNFPLQGSLDNVRFYNRKLSSAEFNQLYLTDPACDLITGIRNYEADAVKVFPNPSEGIFTILNEGKQSLRFSLFNALGEFILAVQPEAGASASMDFSQYPAGVYFLCCDDSNAPVQKLVKIN
jgi:hypothetical protein